MALERGNKVGSADLVKQLTADTHIQGVILVDETGAPVSVGGGGGGGGAGSDRELVQTTYRAKNAFSGASVGDVITLIQIIDVTSTPTTVSSIWRNQTTGADLGSAPSAANLELVGSQALTAAQLEVSSLKTDLDSIEAKTPSLVSGAVPSLQRQIDSSGNVVTQQATENGATNIGNAYKKFRDGFSDIAQGQWPDAAIWSEGFVNQGTGFRGRRGNAAGSAYMVISMCPINLGFEYTMETIRRFKYPMRFMVGHSMSQRVLGQEVEMSIVGVDGVGAVENLTAVPDMTISGTVTVASNVATINFATAHPYKGGDRIILKGNSDNRLNVGPVIVTVVTALQITVPLTLANASYTAGGSCEWIDPFKYAKNAIGILNENTSVTQASWVTRRNGYNTRLLQGQTVASSTATQSNTSPYSDAFNAAARHEFTFNQEESLLVSRAQDSLGGPSGNFRWSQGIPDEEKEYKLRIRAKNLNCLARPVARITAIAKTGTTTATVTTDVAHNLTTNSWVQIYGVRDQTNFPNLTAITQVASIVSSTQFTIIIGAAVTASSAGGAVWLSEGSVLAPGVFSQVVQSISRTSNILTLVGNAAWATPLPGENVHLYGCDATSMGLYDGAYKVLRVSGTSLEVDSTGADFGTINCGGSLIRRTDVRVHFVSEIEYTRLIAELSTQNGAADSARSLPVNIVNSPNITTVTTVTAANLATPGTVADVASAALTTTTTTSTITPTNGPCYQVNIPVTAVSGTTPTLDVVVQESDDSGTNWYDVYHFPRITATGMYRSPILPLQGNRVRYVQTVGGTTPSFTRAINRSQMSLSSAQVYRQLFDRAIVLTTLSSTTASLLVEGCRNLQLVINLGAATTPPALQLQVSEDGTNWVNVGTPLTGVASSAALATVSNITGKFARAIVTTAGATVTAGFVQVKGF